jgi:hypothetical protein
MIIELNFNPRPVRVTTPTMTPAAAQVEATLNTPIEPPLSARTNFLGVRAVSFLMKLTAKVMTVDQKTAMMGVKPMTMITTNATRETKRNP